MTLFDVCEELSKTIAFSSLDVMYRTNLPGQNILDEDAEDTLFGYCTVHRKMSGYSVESMDGDNYNMSDEISRYVYNPDYFEGLVVWVESEWNNI